MKSNLDSAFKTHESSEKNGIWFNITDTTGFLIKPFKPTNQKFKGAMAKHYKPYAYQVEQGTLSYEKQLEINIKLFIDVCLVDWKGVEIDGKDTPYSPEVALPLFIGLPELFHTLWKRANDTSSYKEELGNS